MFVWNNFIVQLDLFYGVIVIDMGSLNIGESYGFIRELDGIGIGNSIIFRNNVFFKRDQVYIVDRVFVGFVLMNLWMYGVGLDIGFVLYQIMRCFMYIMVMSFSMCFFGRFWRR